MTAPFGRQWNASTINGNQQRGNGIFCNPLYVGRLIYNRVRMIKAPETGPSPECRLTVDKFLLSLLNQAGADSLQFWGWSSVRPVCG